MPKSVRHRGFWFDSRGSTNQEREMDEHVNDYYAYLDAMDWREACEQQKRDEGIWEDNGCHWPTN